MKKTFALLLALLCLPVMATAEEKPPAETAEVTAKARPYLLPRYFPEEFACQKEVEALCAGVLAQEGWNHAQVELCLFANRDKVSVLCKGWLSMVEEQVSQRDNYFFRLFEKNPGGLLDADCQAAVAEKCGNLAHPAGQYKYFCAWEHRCELPDSCKNMARTPEYFKKDCEQSESKD